MSRSAYLLQSMTDLPDSILADHVNAGDQFAFEQLVSRYQKQLFAFICQFLGDYDQAGDVLQQVLMRLYLSMPMLSTEASLRPWLYRVARNLCVDTLRKRRRMQLFFELDLDDEMENLSPYEAVVDPHPLPEEIAEQHELQHILQQAIALLPPNFRSVVELRYLQQLEYSEIGRRLSIPETTAKTRCHRARRLLYNSLVNLKVFL